MRTGRTLINVIDTTWSPNLAYAAGLMASDGYLRRDSKEISLVSKDRELIDLFRKSIAIRKEPFKTGRGNTSEKNYWTIRFKSKNFHDFLASIGITPSKSRSIQSVSVPDEYFIDFLRGLYDGDGTFWTWWDKRWPNSFGYTLGFSSASILFVNWLKNQLHERYEVKGYIHIGKGVYTVRYVKSDSRKLFYAMYYNQNLLYLSRKYHKIKVAFDFDDQLKHARIAK